jgi:hypothetical protein
MRDDAASTDGFAEQLEIVCGRVDGHVAAIQRLQIQLLTEELNRFC